MSLISDTLKHAQEARDRQEAAKRTNGGLEGYYPQEDIIKAERIIGVDSSSTEDQVHKAYSERSGFIREEEQAMFDGAYAKLISDRIIRATQSADERKPTAEGRFSRLKSNIADLASGAKQRAGETAIRAGAKANSVYQVAKQKGTEGAKKGLEELTESYRSIKSRVKETIKEKLQLVKDAYNGLLDRRRQNKEESRYDATPTWRVADNSSDLRKELKAAARQGRFSPFPDEKLPSKGDEGPRSARHAWTHHHDFLIYNGEELHIKSPRLKAEYLITAARAASSRLHDIVNYTALRGGKAIMVEEQALQRLQQHGVSVPTPRPDVREEAGLYNILITDHISEADNLLDLEDVLEYLPAIGENLSRAHGAGVAWNDAWLGNVLRTGGDLYLIDWEATVRGPGRQQMSHDLLRLISSVEHHTDHSVPQAWDALLEGYQPDNKMRRAIRDQSERLDNKWRLPGAGAYFGLVYGPDRETVQDVARLGAGAVENN